MKLELFKVLGESFSYLKDNWKRYIGVTLMQLGIIALIFIIPVSVWNKSEAVPTTIFYGADLSFLWVLIMIIPWAILSVVFRNVYMVITDDAYEGREMPFKEQWKYAFKKCGSVILAVIIYNLPIFIVTFIFQWGFLRDIMFLQFILNIAINIVSILFILTEAAILVDDCSAIDGIKKSIEIMKHNIFRYIGFAIGLGFLITMPMMLIPFIMQVDFMFYVILVILVPVFIYLMPISDVFQTLLYKSATEPEDMLEEMLINDVE